MSITRRTLLAAAGGAALRASSAARRPNILIVMTDQQFAEALSCRMGRRYIRTPHMDSLAARGTFFTRAYCANPLCVPSRTSMFTGRYPVETGVQTNDTIPIDARRFPMMGTMFREAGYATAFFGKWHMPYPEKDTASHGFELVDRYRPARDESTTAGLVDFLRAPRREPFLLVASMMNPHNICQWPRGEKLPDGDVGAPPPPDQCPPLRANHAPQLDEPDAVTLLRRSYQAHTKFPVGGFDAGKWRQYIWAYYRMIEKVDAQIGQVLGSLREAGLQERTLVVFLADHGDCQGAHGWNQKTVFYEEAARVPFILSYPGVTRRTASNRLVHTGVDLIPTLCSYAGIDPPPGLPGLSLRETAEGAGGLDRRTYVVLSNKGIEGAEIDGRLPAPEGRMVRSRRYKYCVFSEGARRESLVDMEKDPGETVNLAGEPTFRAILERHRAMLAEWSRQTGDGFSLSK